MVYNILKQQEYVASIERMTKSLKPYSDDWYVWESIRQEEQTRLDFMRQTLKSKTK